MKYEHLKIFGDLLLIINQIKGIYACNQPHLKKYKAMVEILLENFKAYDIEVTPRSSNRFVNIMASLGSLILQNPFRKGRHMEVITIYKYYLYTPLYHEVPLTQINELNVVFKDLWYH